ncbi:MAG TPA: hypothetical protein ACFYD6_14000 [Candidatus Brocadiia bacterium]|nr:hypothetical protein [Planctomycetota bacterium]MDO8093946.1 hypothetical protein [Candidatus Brocadiales bacterium]
MLEHGQTSSPKRLASPPIGLVDLSMPPSLMIINVYTFIMLFAAAVSLVIGAIILPLSYKLVTNWEKENNSEMKGRLERTGYLVLLIACVILAVRMASWPFFYFTLRSYVPEVPGAMCMFGVTQIFPHTVWFLQIIKPIAFFAMGGWFLLYYIDNQTNTSPLAVRKFALLAVISIVILADSIGDLYYFIRMKPLMTVSCCATFYDIPVRASAMIPRAVLGGHYEKNLLPVYYTTNLTLISLLAYMLWQGIVGLNTLWKKVAISVAITLGAINALVVILSFFEVISPRLMQLPYHHCMYCFIGNGLVPDAPIILGLFILGTYGIGWILLLTLICRGYAEKDIEVIVDGTLKRLLGFSILCLLGAVLMVSTHLIIL